MNASQRSDITFLPLGGCGEIGMNFNLFGHDGQWIAVDCGITLEQDSWSGASIGSNAGSWVYRGAP